MLFDIFCALIDPVKTSSFTGDVLDKYSSIKRARELEEIREDEEIREAVRNRTPQGDRR